MGKKKRKTMAVVKLQKIKVTFCADDFPLWLERYVAEFRSKKDARRIGLA